jgi:hypothetical protein
MVMIFQLRHWWNLHRIYNERRRIFKRSADAYRRAIEKNESAEELQRLREERDRVVQRIDDEIMGIESARLYLLAYQLGIPTDWGELKHFDDVTGDERRLLLIKKISELRVAIRKERNERWQFWELRLKVLTALAVALTGAMGAAIGLIATWTR